VTDEGKPFPSLSKVRRINVEVPETPEEIAARRVLSRSPTRGGSGKESAGGREAWDLSVRTFTCKTCGKKVREEMVPAGWYLVERATGFSKKLRCGLFCSAVCLQKQTPRLVAIEKSLGDDWVARTMH
jgi:hypothetical protein